MSPLARPTFDPHALWLRRWVLLAPAALLTATGGVLAWQMGGEIDSAVDVVLLGIFLLLFAMLALNTCAMVLGLGLGLGGHRVALEDEARALTKAELAPSRATRTAVLIPAYHEDAREIFARVKVMRASLAALQPKGVESDIDIFVLSDSQNPAAIAAEAAAYKACVAGLPAHGPAVYYRRRSDNVGYKVGNIKDFCTRFGAVYDHMLVLDADSLMAGETIRRMIVLMERHGRIGLLQTSFIPIGRETLFCRVMQFSARLYLPPSALGLAFWQGANGNYWGHNALIRTRAFLDTCGLPELPGKAPLGGRILSHDIVEAALLARGGWEAFLLPTLGGTYEELPTNLMDYMQRDRRWCAGNLQHTHVMRAEGTPFINRLHMGMGIMSYASGPLWLAFVGLSLLACSWNAATGQVDDGGLLAGMAGGTPAAVYLFVLTLVMLFGPKLATLGLALVRRDVRRRFGGAGPLLASALLEQVFGMLLQPVAMLFYTAFVVQPLLGRVVRWEAQPRSERGISWQEALLRQRVHLPVGAALLAGVVLAGNGISALWLAPVIAGIFAGPAFTVLTSRVELGRLARRWKLFLTVDELAPAAEVRALQDELAKPFRKAFAAGAVEVLPPEAHAVMPVQTLRYGRGFWRGFLVGRLRNA